MEVVVGVVVVVVVVVEVVVEVGVVVVVGVGALTRTSRPTGTTLYALPYIPSPRLRTTV